MPSKREVQRAAKRMHEEGDGIWQMSIIDPDNMPELVRNALSGDVRAAKALGTMQQTMEMLWKAKPSRKAFRCLLCVDVTFHAENLPALFVMACASVDAPSAMLCNGICRDCTGRHPDPLLMREAVMAAYSKGWGGDWRVLPDEAPGGHA